MVGVYFDVLVGYTFLLENGPHPLHEGAEPPGVQRQGRGVLMRGHDFGCAAGGGGVDVCVGDGHCVSIGLFRVSQCVKLQVEGKKLEVDF